MPSMTALLQELLEEHHEEIQSQIEFDTDIRFRQERLEAGEVLTIRGHLL